MGIRSTLTKGVRRTWENNKPQLKHPSSGSSKTNSSFRKESNQGGDSDSEATSFSSSVHGSTSSGSSSTSSGIERGKQQRKPLDHLNSQKSTVSGPSRRRPQSRLKSVPDDDGSVTTSPIEPSDASPDLQKPIQKFTRSGSLRSLKILRKKNTPSSESKKPSTDNVLHSKKATFSSILKDSKFPDQVEPQVGVKESEEVLSAAKLCPYEHCSLHGNHHHHEPPVKRFSYLKRRSSKDQRGINPQNRATDKQPVKKKEGKVTKKASSGCDVDSSIEFYAKTRAETGVEPNCRRDDVHLADIMFGVNDDDDDQNEVRNLQMDGQDRSVVNILGENENQTSMWRLIHRHIDQLLQEEKHSSFDDEDVANQGKEIQKTYAVKIVREAIGKILEEAGSETNQRDDQTEPNQRSNDSAKTDKQNRWKYVKEVILMRRIVTELEKAQKKLDPDNCGHNLIAPKPKPEPEPEPEAEIVSLRSQTAGEKKNSNEWMLDYALQQVVAELAPTQKRKVALLVKSFETITPKVE